MKTIIRYVPFIDEEDLEFDSYEECEAYENQQRKLIYGCHFFDRDGNEYVIKEDNLFEDLERYYNIAVRLVFDNVASKIWLKEQLGFCSRFELLSTTLGCLSYYADDSEWIEEELSGAMDGWREV